MSNFRIQQAVAAILAVGAASAASAIDITTVAAGDVLYASGSTAIDPQLQNYFIGQLCQGGTSTKYAGTTTGKKFVGVACNSVGAAGLPAAGTPIAIIKEDNAGSSNGITPVSTATPPAGGAFPDYTTLGAANCPAGTCGATYGTVPTLAPNMGFADEDAAVFALDSTGLTSFPTLDLVFAPAVSLGFYHALQQNEGLGSGDDVSNMPTLDWAWLNHIFVNEGTTWCEIANHTSTSPFFTELGGTEFHALFPITAAFAGCGGPGVVFGNQNGASCWTSTGVMTPCAAAPVANPSNVNIYICQRGQSSGSEHSAGIFLENQYCATGVKQLSGSPATCHDDGCGWSSAFNGNKNFAAAGTGDLLSCLEAHDQQGEFAIGFASTDNGWGTFQSNTTRRDFRYARVNGVAPSIENVSADRYRWWVQSVGYNPAAGAANAPVGDALSIATFVSSATSAAPISAVATITAANVSKQYQAGDLFDGGALGVPGVGTNAVNGPNATLAAFVGNPVNSLVKNGGTNVTNNCQLPIPFRITTAVAYSIDNDPSWMAPWDMMGFECLGGSPCQGTGS